VGGAAVQKEVGARPVSWTKIRYRLVVSPVTPESYATQKLHQAAATRRYGFGKDQQVPLIAVLPALPGVHRGKQGGGGGAGGGVPAYEFQFQILCRVSVDPRGIRTESNRRLARRRPPGGAAPPARVRGGVVLGLVYRSPV
jgi:hypothetical protein